MTTCKCLFILVATLWRSYLVLISCFVLIWRFGICPGSLFFFLPFIILDFWKVTLTYFGLSSKILWPKSVTNLHFNVYFSLFLTGDKVTELFKFDYLVLITYNPGHDILELCNILVQIQFTTSKMKLDICYNKLCMPHELLNNLGLRIFRN